MSEDTNLIAALDCAERELLDRLVRHPVLEGIDSLPREQFLGMLLQRRFISLMFATVYDMGIDALTDRNALELARVIAREEYPDPSGGTPSHREDLMHDLRLLGVTKGQVLASRPTATTTAMLIDTLTLMGEASAAAGDAPVLAMLRFWGEVVVSVEYGAYLKHMAPEFEAAGEPPRFYYEHFDHDGCEELTHASLDSRTHSGLLGACLKRLVDTTATRDAILAIETQVLDIRMRFYDQFM